jgi:predicted dehydrogenase
MRNVMADAVRFAVVGTGAIAQLTHLPVLAKLKGAELVALCDNDLAKARALADRFAIPNTYTDLEELLESDEVDAVVVATPNHLHEPHVLAALRGKVHVMCERPLGLTARGVERILAAAARVDRMVFVANNHRFRTDVQNLERFLRNGELGQLTGIRAGAYTLKRPDAGWRQRRAESGGGAFLDQGFPLLDLALWMADFPAPVRLSAALRRSGRGAAAVEDGMHVTLECEGGVTFVFDVLWNYVGPEDRTWFEVLATRGSGRLAPLRVVKELNGRAIDVSPRGGAQRESAFLQSYRAELTHFVATITGEVAYEAPSDQVTVHKVLEAAYKAAEDEKEIRF